MDTWLVVLLGALAVAAIVIGAASAYTMSTVAKLPDQGELIHLFLAGSMAGGLLAWLVNSGYLHGYSFVNMAVEDVKNMAKEVGLKGGDETATATVASAVSKGSNDNSTVTQMVGGFLNSMGINSESLPQLTVGMPSF
jgi:hypothetical protein